MKGLDIALKEMRQSLRSRSALVFMFAIPILVTVLFYFMFGSVAGGDGEFVVPQTTVVVANLDEGEAPPEAGLGDSDSMGALLLQMLQGEGVVGLVRVTEAANAAAARTVVDRQEAGVAVIIPPNFTEALVAGGETAVVELYNDPTLSVGPAIVTSLVEQMVDGMAAAAIGAGVTVEQLAGIGAPVSPEMVQAVADDYSALVLPQQVGELVTLQSPPGGQVENNELAELLALILGGMMVFYAFFTGANVLHSILAEEENGTLQRLFTTPTPRATIFGGKLLAALLILTVQVTALLVFGRLVFGIRWGELSAVIMAAAGLVLIAATTGLFLVSLLKGTRQAGVVFGGLLTLTGMLGLFPVFTAGSTGTSPALETVSLLVPQGWAVRGLRQSMEGRPLSDLALTVGAVMLWSAAFFIIGQFRLRRRFA